MGISEPQKFDMTHTSGPYETSNELTDGAHSPQLSKSGVKRASTACQSCKRIKRKCDQQHPCSNCQKVKTVCIYDQEQDGRRRTARKRNIEELESQKEALEKILGALRDADDNDAQLILRMIKDNASLEALTEIAAKQTQSAGSKRTKRPALSISALCDTPLVRVPAQPWTTVTDDDDLVSHLVSIFFTWFYPAFPSMVRKSFLAAMSAKELESEYCSPLLVNSILALACQFSDDRRVLHLQDDTTNRGGRFLTQALQLWAEDAGKLSVTTIQAGQALAVALTLTGRDRLSLSYIDQLTDLGSDLLFRTETGNDGGMSHDMRQSIQLALWSLYQLNVGYGMAFMRPRTYTPPKIAQSLPNDTDLATESYWIPYPDSKPRIETNLGNIISIQYKLSEVGAEISSFVFNKSCEGERQYEAFRDIDSRLQLLSQSLPEYNKERVICPHTMDLHLYYHWLRVTLFHFSRNMDSSSQSNSTSNTASDYRKAQCWHSAGIMTNLYQQYFRDFGSRTFTMWMPQTATSLAYILSEDLHCTDVHDMFHEACLVMTCAARKWFVMRGHTRMLYVSVQKENTYVPERTRDLLRSIASDSWQADSHKHFVASVYPHYALALGQDPRTAAMGDLLERWADFHLDQSAADGEETIIENGSV